MTSVYAPVCQPVNTKKRVMRHITGVDVEPETRAVTLAGNYPYGWFVVCGQGGDPGSLYFFCLCVKVFMM